MNNRGVTLVELVIVLAIFGIGLVSVGMSADSDSARRLNAAYAALQTDIRYAQRQAVIENKRYELVFSRADNGYVILVQEPGLGVSRVIKEVAFDDDIVIEGTTAVNSSIVFTERGTTANACTITLQNSKYVVNITVNLGSGRVMLKSFDRL